MPIQINLRRADDNERFVAFAFASAEIVIETDMAGLITYAAGALHSRFGRPADSFIGEMLRSLVAPADHEALASAQLLLSESGRLQPLLVRLADKQRSRLAIAGLALPATGRPARLYFTLARSPMPLATMRAGTPHTLARATEARLRGGEACALSFLEIAGDRSALLAASDAIGQALETLAPDAVASEVAPGRFGLLGPGGTAAGLVAMAAALEATLRREGLAASVASQLLPVDTAGLSSVQAVRALRQALNAFTRDGVPGLAEAGFAEGLAGYIRNAGQKAAGLRRAIRGGHFALAFQPIVRIGNRAVHHYEALIRPKDIPGHSFGDPQGFVMMVEALGLADELDLAVAREACKAAQRAGVSVALNLSGQSVQDIAFRGRLLALLQADPACKAGLVLVEMTETAEIEDVDEAARTASALRDLGVAFCLDDFGAGAADIRMLRSLKPDIVKLDGSYISGIDEGGREHAFVAGMIEIARAAGAEIVAERVETEAEAAALGALSVEYGQGWLFGRPGPLPERSAARAARRRGELESWG